MAPEVEHHAFYLTAWEEEKYVIAQANAPSLDKTMARWRTSG